MAEGKNRIDDLVDKFDKVHSPTREGKESSDAVVCFVCFVIVISVVLVLNVLIIIFCLQEEYDAGASEEWLCSAEGRQLLDMIEKNAEEDPESLDKPIDTRGSSWTPRNILNMFRVSFWLLLKGKMKGIK